MSAYAFDAVIFDLDGVVTKTALVHSAAWKKMFDGYLREREARYGEPFREFTMKDDYLPYVDGKPRYKGVESFLASRGISLPYGDPSDPPEKETVCGIGNRKNIAFNEALQSDGVEVYDSTVSLLHKLKEEGIRIGVASSSKNCRQVLERAGLLDMFETRVDGEVSAELGLKGKPEPDIFTVAADNLGVTYDRTVVVEDAVSGVEAGRKGNFGLVLGLAREENEKELYAHGADIVVKDMADIGFEGIVDWFKTGLWHDNWSITYHDYVPEKEKTRETLLAVGNGYFGTRGAMAESGPGKFNYPGTYMAGVYNRLISKVGDRDIENEDFVNVINWLPVTFRIEDDEWFDINNTEIIKIKRVLHFNTGVLYRRVVVRDAKGRETRIETRRMASMDDPHLAAQEYTITPLNYEGKITVRSGLHGDHINAGVERYSQLNQKHIKPVLLGSEENIQHLVVRTTQSNIAIAAAAQLTVFKGDERVYVHFRKNHTTGRSQLEFHHSVSQGETLKMQKTVALYHNLDRKEVDPLEEAMDSIKKYRKFDEVLEKSSVKWEDIWDKIDIRIAGDRLAQKLLRLHLYHMMVTTSPLNAVIDFGIPARGLHGEAYRGHIFWDELYILPLYNMHFPEVTRAALMYRYRRLGEARKYAAEYGYQGAMFPWQSGSSGREETQVIHLNPVSGEWGPDHSSLQRHVSLAIAYNVWQYYHSTGDMAFMVKYGAELLFEICRFWAGKSKLNKSTGRYEIAKVMGPDEFHEKYQDTDEGGLKDNAYTNLMVAWMLERAAELLEKLNAGDKSALLQRLGLTPGELERWNDIASRLNLVISDEGIIAQYDGYFALEELDFDAYRNKYGNIHRMDRLLKAEGKSPDQYKVAKQADTLMTFYNLNKAEVDRILDKLGYRLPEDYLMKNLRYYLARTSHGSTLSRVVHAQLANITGDHKLSWDLYLDALTSDYQDIQGGTTAEGIHAGVMAGTVLVALSSYAGLDLHGDMPYFNPNLPDHWRKISFSFEYRGSNYECEVTPDSIRIRIESRDEETVAICVNNKVHEIISGDWIEIEII
ncbi:MAG: beta-phosphoglucomutase family hydrolase [Bacteroidales bacterium]|nr:beta-phosphoglucomutase family hydrolase [Bacteroidales bacterium]